jgi:tetratricopeptide (TPR) repeat protein
MMPGATDVLNQQFQQASQLSQFAAACEAGGNLLQAAQTLEQAAALIGASMQTAQMWFMPVPESIYFAIGSASFQAARVQTRLGFAQLAFPHLAQSLWAFNQAIAINPTYFGYHAWAGTVLAAQGNLWWADQALQRALQLNPQDQWSTYMLSSIRQSQGHVAQGQQMYSTVQQSYPGAPPPIQMMNQPASGAGASQQGFTVGNATEIFKAISAFGDAFKSISGMLGGFSSAGF